jgi:hypothetical protein
MTRRSSLRRLYDSPQAEAGGGQPRILNFIKCAVPPMSMTLRQLEGGDAGHEAHRGLALNSLDLGELWSDPLLLHLFTTSDAIWMPWRCLFDAILMLI